MSSEPNTYRVSAAARQPLVDFLIGGLKAAGCKIISEANADTAPFVLSFEDPKGERIGIVAYAFLATRTPTKNRPKDERSFQIKYGSKEAYAHNNSHEIWQDPLGIFTTLLLGIDPEEGFCVSADPVIHNPTKFFIRVEFKDEHAEEISRKGWHAWQRIKRRVPLDAPRVETLVGATKDHLLELIRFERAAQGVDPGNRLIIAERQLPAPRRPSALAEPLANLTYLVESHPLVAQLKLSPTEILNLIDGTRRLKMAVRGWVAEEHLRSAISKVPGVTHCERLDVEGGPDLAVSFRRRPILTIECKNVARETDKHGNPKIDFQRTRAAKGNPCSRYYRQDEFDVVAACLHAVTTQWDFKYNLPGKLPPHKDCEGRISSNIRVDKEWVGAVEEMFHLAYSAKGIVL
jgi:hypothetical protein